MNQDLQEMRDRRHAELLSSLKNAEAHADELISRLAARSRAQSSISKSSTASSREEDQWERLQLKSLSANITSAALSRAKRDHILGGSWHCFFVV